MDDYEMWDVMVLPSGRAFQLQVSYYVSRVVSAMVESRYKQLLQEAEGRIIDADLAQELADKVNWFFNFLQSKGDIHYCDRCGQWEWTKEHFLGPGDMTIKVSMPDFWRKGE